MSRGKVVFLGTSAGMPTKKRGLPSVCLVWKGENILFDAGEGTQRQMMFAGISLLKTSRILVTHTHGDHMLGIPGMLMTMSLLGREDTVDIHGPVGTRAFVECLLPSIREGLTFGVNVHELADEGLAFKGKGYSVFCCRADHVQNSWAYKFVEDMRPGRFDEARARALGLAPSPKRRDLVQGKEVVGPCGKVIKSAEVVAPPRPGFSMVYTGDVAPSESIVRLSEGVDILIHESTFDREKEGEAATLRHSTTVGAARAAAKANVKLLVLTHISARYEDTETLRKQAQEIFPKVIVAEDLRSIDVD